jgi:hypothetical protein
MAGDEVFAAHVCPDHSGVQTDVGTLKQAVIDLWAAVNALRNRLPVWATLLIAGQAAAIGALGAALISHALGG